MYGKLFGFLLFASQIIFNKSYTVVSETTGHISAVIGVTPTPAPSGTLPEGYLRFPDVHAAYKLHEEDSTWSQANDLCISQGARLAITDTVEKIAHIKSIKKVHGKWLHVGIHLSNTTNEWVRIDNGLPIAGIPWKEDNPDDAGNCAGISITRNALVNYPCDWGHDWYVCEIPI